MVGRIVRSVGAVLGAAVTLWGVAPLVTGRLLGIGSLAMLVVGVLVMVICIRFRACRQLVCTMWQHVAWRVVLSVVAALAVAFFALFTVVSVLMAGAVSNTPADDATVVVLGAGIYENRPSLVLRERLDAAAAYLEQHPQALCIVSGGQGPDEICTEASVMKQYLTERGIAAERIVEEDKSESTAQNIAFSKAIMEERGLPLSVAVVTQDFHQYRAQQFAKRAGFSAVGGVAADTPWYLLGAYWVRDFAGICHMVVFGS